MLGAQGFLFGSIAQKPLGYSTYGLLEAKTPRSGQKKLLIGRGGGFQQESQQRYSPVSFWLTTVHVALTDEAQQYGNIDELTTLARLPAIRQRQNNFGVSCFLGHWVSGDVVSRFTIGPPGSMADRWTSYLRGHAVEVLGGKVVDYLQRTSEDLQPVYKAALAVLFLATRREVMIPIASTLKEAAGTANIHRWSLILPSSARVCLLTYQIVVGVRYSELVKYRDGVYHFGRFFPEGSAPRGGFFPILWDAPKSDTYAVQDIGLVVEHVRACFGFTAIPEDSLAVLHNKNRLVHAFGRSGWVHDTRGEVVSRSITSCAGMTAKVTIIALWA